MKQSATKNTGPAHGVGGGVWVHTVPQQLEGCVGWVYVRGRCAVSDFSHSLSKFNAIGVLYLPRAAAPRVEV
jgi:hypothetical protein